MRVLLTGGAGFIGSHVLEALLLRGDSVTVVDDFNPYYDPALKRGHLAGIRGFALVEGDLRDPDLAARAVRESKADAIIHLAGQGGVRPSLAQPALYNAVNTGATLNLLEACRQEGVRRFVFGSSSTVYGETSRVPFREDETDLRPISPYGVSKLVAEHYVRVAHRLHGLRTTVLRFFSVYGPRQRPDMAFHTFARLLREGREVPVFGDGSSRRDYTYVDDTVQGVLAAVDRDEGFEIYNIAESRTVDLNTVLGLLEKHLGRRAVRKTLPEQPGDVKQTHADITKARQRLGYDPRTPVEEGIRRFADWFKTLP